MAYSYYGQVYPQQVGYPFESSYQRPRDWLPLLPLNNPEEEIVCGLYPVYEIGVNMVAFEFEGDYEVDWGDGSTESYNSGQTAEHTYDYASISENTLCTRGYKQVVVTVRPAPGQQLSFINLAVTPSYYTNPNYYSGRWLDIAMNVPNAGSGKSINVSGDDTTSYYFFPALLESLHILSTGGATDFYEFLVYAGSLREVEIREIPVIADTMESMFADCYAITDLSMPYLGVMNGTFSSNLESLVNVSIGDLTPMDDTYDLFYECYTLKNVFIGKMSAAAEYMFDYCYSLESVIIQDATDLVDGYAMFYSANIKQFNLPPTPNLQDASYMFESSYIETVSFEDLGSLLDSSYMFYECYNLLKVSFPSTPALSLADHMFTYCSSLTEVIFSDLPSLEYAEFMFQYCYSLQEVSLTGFSVNYSLYYPFESTSALESIYLPSSPSALDSLTVSCYSLRTLEMEDCSNLASPGYTLIDAPNLAKLRVPNMATDFSVANCSLSREALVQVFEDLAPVVSASIDITGNWGEALLTPEDIQIATDKGWTIGPF